MNNIEFRDDLVDSFRLSMQAHIKTVNKLRKNHPNGFLKAPENKTKIDIIFRPLSLWIGVHHSKFNNQTCINIIPTITIRIKWKQKK